MQSDYNNQGKTSAIVAYITIVGTIIAFFMNQETKNQFASFHIRQALGIHITFYLLGSLVSIFDSWLISTPFYIFIAVLWFYGIVTAIQEQQKPVPIIGTYFQQWFGSANK